MIGHDSSIPCVYQSIVGPPECTQCHVRGLSDSLQSAEDGYVKMVRNSIIAKLIALLSLSSTFVYLFNSSTLHARYPVSRITLQRIQK